MNRAWRLLVLCSTAVLIASACGGGSSTSAHPSTTVKHALGADNPADQSAGDPSQGAYTPTGTLVADDGFRPADNGFHFPNYGDQLQDGSGPASSLDATGMQQLFGTAVCANAACDLTPEALAMMNQLNASMAGGHCYGFSVASQLIWTGQIKPSDYGAAAVNGLTITGNTALQREIAYAWAFQTLPAVQNAQIQGDPNSILNQLKTLLASNPKETYTIGIYSSSGGHAITPYAIEDNGGGMFHVLVYDNNWPGITRGVVFDTNKDTWSYVAALNPNDPSELYSGDATTPNIALFPSGPGLGTQPWAYGGTNGAQATQTRAGSSDATLTAFTATPGQKMEEVYLSGSDTHHGHLLITNPAGQQIGWVNGKMVDTIPGAKAMVSLTSRPWLESQEPEYVVPFGDGYKVSIDGGALHSADDGETVGVVAPGYEVKVGHIDLNPGETDTMNVSADGSSVAYTASDPQDVTVNDGVTDSSADYNFSVKGDEVSAGSTVTFGVPAGGDKFDISDSSGDASSQVTVDMQEENAQGEQDFTHSGVDLTGGDSAALDPTNWSNGKDISLDVTKDGQSTTEDLSDQPGDAAPPDDSESQATTSGSDQTGPQATEAPVAPETTEAPAPETTEAASPETTEATPAETAAPETTEAAPVETAPEVTAAPETSPPATAAPDTSPPETSPPDTASP